MKFFPGEHFLRGAMCIIASALCLGLSAQELREVRRMDARWQFHCGDIENAQQPALDDSGWQTLDLPHDWSIAGPFLAENPTGRGGGYLPSGVVWYRKHLTLPASDKGKRILVEFEGIMENGAVWVNGQPVGSRPYGYTASLYDITDKVNFGKENIIAVKADTSAQPASRWYTGGGIYRHVNLIKTSPLHLDHWGVFIHTPEVSAEKAVVKIQARVVNDGRSAAQAAVQTTLTAPDGRRYVSQKKQVKVEAGADAECTLTVEVDKPMLWDTETPHLYSARTEVSVSGKPTDDRIHNIGIRDIRWEPATGFWLNGRNLKLKGVCMHHEAGPLGAAVPRSAWERRIQRIKEIGSNAIRTAHNPMDQSFLDACDKLGVLVMCEYFDCWRLPKNPHDYARAFDEWWQRDVTDIVIRDRNHPCVVIRSMGNEIRDDQTTEEGFNTLRGLRDLTHSLDPTRPVTMALFRPNVMKLYDNGFADLLDVVGQNYRENELVAAHVQNPGRIVIGTENRPDRDRWLVLRDSSFMSGQFIWAGFDYLGESQWPAVSLGTRCPFDRNALYKPKAWELQSWWSDQPMVHIVRHAGNNGEGAFTDDWTPVDFGYDQAVVVVYSNCEEVELFLNGVSQGVRKVGADAAPCRWEMDFVAGTLRAVGRKGGVEVASQECRTAGEPARVELKAERNTIADTWDDVVYLVATVTDSEGTRCPNGDYRLDFSVEGPGRLVGLDNGNLQTHESFSQSHYTTYKGRVVAIVRATASEGDITVKVSCEGLGSSQATLKITDNQ